MAENRTTDAVKLNLRLPKSLHRQLVQQAARRNVSLNTEIVEQLQGSQARSHKDLQKKLVEAVTKSMRDSPPSEWWQQKMEAKPISLVWLPKEWENTLSELLTKAVRDSARVAAETTAEILQKENRDLRPPG